MLATKKLYKLMSLEEYKAALKIHTQDLNSNNKNYQNLSLKEKWDTVIERFKTLAPASVEELESFRLKRLNAPVTIFNIPLEDCVYYFENFIFLYEVDDPKFKLNITQKTSFLADVAEAIGTCETGLNTRFEQVLQKYRTDLNWVTNLLSKTRYELVTRMQVAYSLKHGIHDALKTHVLKRMKERTQYAYGIAVERSIMDVYAYNIDGPGVDQYVDINAPRIFTIEYEEEIVNILSRDLLAQIQEKYCPQDLNWDHIAFVIPVINWLEFKNYVIENRIRLPRSIENEIGVLLDEDTEGLDGEMVPATYDFKLKKKGEMLVALRGLIREKLINEQYFIPFEKLNEENSKLLHSPEHQKIANKIIAFRAQINSRKNSFKEIGNVLSHHQQFLLNHPEVLVELIEFSPNTFKLLPNRLKTNPYFIKQSIPIIISFLDRNDVSAENKELLREIVVRLLRNAPRHISLLPVEMFTQAFSLQLVKNIPEALPFIPAAIQGLEAIQNAACKEISRGGATRRLLTEPDLSLETVALLMQQLSLGELSRIISTRKIDGLPPLPFTPTPSTIEIFKRSLSTRRVNWNNWPTEYERIREEGASEARFKKADDIYNYLNRIDNIVQNKYWYMALVQSDLSNSVRFTSFNHFLYKCFEQLSKIFKLIFEITKFLLNVFLGFALSGLAHHVIFSLLPAWAVPLLLIGMLSPLLTNTFQNRMYTLVSTGAALFSVAVLLLNRFIAYFTALYVMIVVPELFNISTDIVKMTIALFLASLNTLFVNRVPELDKRGECESVIEQLECSEGKSEREKAAILTLILAQIDQEISAEVQSRDHDVIELDSALNQKLSKAYTITYQNKEYTLSFNRAAEIICVGNKPLVLEKNNKGSVFRFFFNSDTDKNQCNRERFHQPSFEQVPAMELVLP